MWPGDDARIPTSDEVNRRAGGRKAYNARRQFIAAQRLHEVAELIAKLGFDRGCLVKIARALGVSGATVTRDVQRLLAGGRVCPTCGKSTG